ncbi:50S ribosomal protein L3 [Candidatus Daviesbacteria bacterium]|nr:50S ribosomal protein L3 [Candidatus Daviesbacteria bacterium]
MIQTLLGTKKFMTSTYDSRGRRVGATVVEMNPNMVTQIKDKEGKDGYDAVQLGYGTKKSVKKPQIGHAKKAGVEGKIRWMREVRASETVKPGDQISLGQVFSVGDAVKITGVSKGKGFQGGVRRHGFHGGPKTHGQSDRHRAPGSIGAGTTPGRVYKGKRMAGHMGVERVSYKGLEVVKVDKQNNLLTIKGGVPGPAGGFVIVEKQGRIKGYTPPPEEKPEEEELESSDNTSEVKSEEPKVEATEEVESTESSDEVKEETGNGSN